MPRRTRPSDAPLVPASPTTPEPLPNADREAMQGAGSIGAKLAEAYRAMVVDARRTLRLELADAEAFARGEGDDDLAARVARQPPSQTTWWELSALAAQDPAQVTAAWEALKGAAADELASGHRAAAALEFGGSPWERARFLAIRAGFREEWQPRGAVEAMLIDTLAQAFTNYLNWTERLALYSRGEPAMQAQDLREGKGWMPPRLTTAATVEQAAAMAERFHRLMLRTLRALQDLRRLTPSVIVQHAGQVNVAQQQVNAVNPAAARPESRRGKPSRRQPPRRAP